MFYEKEHSTMKVSYSKGNYSRIRAQGRLQKIIIEGFQDEKWKLRKIKVREVVTGCGAGLNTGKDPVVKVGGSTVHSRNKKG